MSKNKDKYTEIQLVYGMPFMGQNTIYLSYSLSYSLRTILGWLKSCTEES